MTATSPTPRSAVRAVVIDPGHRILLVRFEDTSQGTSWWATPGGALAVAESDQEGLRRELSEETGLREFDLGPCIWTRSHTFRVKGSSVSQHERFYLIRVSSFSPRPEGLEPIEKEFFREVRWWTPEELRDTHEDVAPRDLPRLVAQLLSDGPPAEPLEVGV